MREVFLYNVECWSNDCDEVEGCRHARVICLGSESGFSMEKSILKIGVKEGL